MKTRREIIDEIIKSGNKVGTIDDIAQEYHVEFDKILSNGVIELIGEDKVCKFSKENYTVMYNYLISDIRNFLGVWCERKQHIK